MELALLGTGGSTTFDVSDILKKGRQAIKDCSSSLRRRTAESHPRCSPGSR